MIGRPPSSVIQVKFHMKPPWDGGTKVCSNGPCHMTKMAAMPIYVSTLKIFFSGTKRPMTLKLSMQHRVLEYYQVCSNDDPGLTLMLLYGEKVKQWIFQKLLSSMI